MLKNFRNPSDSLNDLAKSLKRTVENEWLRLFIISLIITFSFLAYNPEEEHTKQWLHVAVEFIGVAFLFLVIEHGLNKLDSGISDPKPLPLEKFIQDIRVAKSELILFDTFLETILLDKKNRIDFETNLKLIMKSNKFFSAKILLLKDDSEFVNLRANQRKVDTNKYRKDMLLAKMELEHIKNQICITDPDCETRIIIQYYDSPPPFAMYSIDESAYVSFYPEGLKTTHSRQLYIPDDTELGRLLFKFYKDAFSTYWKSNDTNNQ